MNVCPPHGVAPVAAMPVPVVVPAVLEASWVGGLSNTTSPGLTVRFTLVGTPAWKSACVVSVRQALVGAALSEKFCVVVAPSFTTMFAAVLELYPGALAVMLG